MAVERCFLCDSSFSGYGNRGVPLCSAGEHQMEERMVLGIESQGNEERK